MKTMMTAQKTFRKINATKKYSVLLYLSTMQENDAKVWSFRASYSYYSCFTRTNAKEELVKSMMDVVSHEFFHIVTPLSIHSKEIQYFDYNPKMSAHYGCTKVLLNILIFPNQPRFNH
jgi:predicted metalloprotease with PDZ domain